MPCDTYHYLLALSRLILSGGCLRCEWFEEKKICKAYDIANNVLSLAYSVLFWKIQIALMKDKLEPYLGFLHSTQWGLPSLVLDFQELYRYLVDDFVIQYFRSVKSRDCVLKTEDFSGKKGKRQFLSDGKAREMINVLDKYFETMVSVPRIRRGRKQELETLINEEVCYLPSI
ncbi:CRISPR-associated endonuclease Cas1 [Candidatus Bathyarchaeota archaeon]|nr:CRISPR-associated endonuclease Cas1 [Candidatus Bathyarchaeota archaeon]